DPMIATFAVVACVLPLVYVPMPIEHLGMVALISILGWTGGLIIIRAYRLGEAVIVAPMQYSQIIWATLYGYLFFDELVDGGTALGAGIIIASGLYIVLRESSSGNSANRPVLNTKMRPEVPSTPRPSLMSRLMHLRSDS